MKYCGRKLLIAVAFCSLAIPLSAFLAQGQCYNVRDASYVFSHGTCGTNEWQLNVSWDGGVIDDVTQGWAYGACNGGYYNCNSQYVAQGYDNGGEQFFDDGPVDDYGERVHWRLDDWTVSYSSCNNGHPNDQIENDNNYWSETQEWEVDCF